MRARPAAWVETARRALCDARIFRVAEREMEGPHGKAARFVTIEAPDWAVVVPAFEEDGRRRLVMVRQFRHGTDRESLEFPGGVVEPGEDPAAAARRELLEETGYRAGRLTPLGDLSPNPAIMENRFRVFLAEELAYAGAQSLDEHEFVDVVPMDEDAALAALGGEGADHALMLAAAFLYGRHRRHAAAADQVARPDAAPRA